MAKIIRYDGNLPSFASGSTGTNRTVFGDTTQSDTITDNITPEYLEGWEIVDANDAPTRQDFNAIAYTTTEILAYLHQMGTPEWNTSQEYHTGSITTQGGALYISRTDTNVGNNPASDVVNWKDVSGESFNDTKYVVDPVAGETDYTTIQGAMDAANASGIGSVVYVRPGAYTENLTFYANVKLKGGDNRQVIITGVHTPPATGTVTIKNVTLISATDAFNSAVAGSATIIMKEVLTQCTNGYTFNLLNWTGDIELDNCHSIGTNDGFLNNTGGANIYAENSLLGIGSGNDLLSNCSIEAFGTKFGCPIVISGACTSTFTTCEFNNNLEFTVDSAAYIEGSYFNTGAIIPFSYNTTGDVYLTRTTFNTTDTTAINGTGTGTLYNGILDFTDGSSIDGDISFVSSNSLAGGIYGWNGSFVEAATETVTEAGGVVTCSIEKEGGGDLTLVSGRGYWHYDTTPADTVTLTVGTDEVPVMNYVYLDGLTKLLTASTSGYPLTGHSPIANILCQSAASIATDGVYKLHSRQNHLATEQNVGHIGHINNWIRAQHATWMSGVVTSFSGDGTGTIGFSNTSGEVLQLHEHAFPAIVDPAPIYCVNDPDTAYRKITNIADLLKDSLGNPLKDRAYGIVFWGCVSEDTGDCKIFCNLPSGDEGDFNKAREDKKKYINYSIPEDFKGTGFLIYKLIIENDNDTTWDLDVAGDGDDLRGQFPSTSAGSSTAFGTEFADSTFRVFDDGDNTKQVALQVSGLTTATTRTMTVPNGDGTIAYNDVAYGGTGANTKTDAFDNLSPTITEGDIIYYNGFDNTRLAKGTAKQILAMNSGATAPEWSSDVNVTSIKAGDITLSGDTISATGDIIFDPVGKVILDPASYSTLATMQDSVNAFPAGTENSLMKANIKGLSLYQDVVNGDFSSGTDEWEAASAVLTESGNVMSVTGSGAGAIIGALTKSTSYFSVKNGDKLFFYTKVRVTNSDTVHIKFQHIATGDINVISEISTPTINTWYESYAIVTKTADDTTTWVQISSTYADAGTASGKVLQLDGNSGIFAINMTELGISSYTEAEMLDLVQQGYFEGYQSSEPEILTAHILANQSITNGDFSDGTTGWTPTYSALTESANVLSITGNGSSPYPRGIGSVTGDQNSGDKVFMYSKTRVTNSNCKLLESYVRNGTLDEGSILVATPTINTWYEIYNTFTLGATAPLPWLLHTYADAGTANTSVMEVDGEAGVFYINMTATGIEDKTLAEMLEFVQTTVYFEGEKADRENYFNPVITLRSLPDGTQDTLQNASDDLSNFIKNWRHTQRVSDGEAFLTATVVNTTNLPSMLDGSSFLLVLDAGGIQTGTDGDTSTGAGTIYYELASPVETNLVLDQLYSFTDGYLHQNGTLLNNIDYSLTQNITSRLDALEHGVEDIDDVVSKSATLDCWAEVDMTAATADALISSFNVASLTDVAVGRWEVYYDTPMNTQTYGYSATAFSSTSTLTFTATAQELRTTYIKIRGTTDNVDTHQEADLKFSVMVIENKAN